MLFSSWMRHDYLLELRLSLAIKMSSTLVLKLLDLIKYLHISFYPFDLLSSIPSLPLGVVIFCPFHINNKETHAQGIPPLHTHTHTLNSEQTFLLRPPCLLFHDLSPLVFMSLFEYHPCQNLTNKNYFSHRHLVLRSSGIPLYL